MNLINADGILQSGCDSGVYTHGVYAIAQGGRTVALKAFGKASIISIFDLASLTKPMATATLLLQAVERGKLHLGEKVSSFFPDFGKLDSFPAGVMESSLVSRRDSFADVDLFQLATHTSGLAAVPTYQTPKQDGRANVVRAVLSTPRPAAPGSSYTYSDTGYILLGEILAKVFEKPLDQLFRENVALPVGLKNTGYKPGENLAARLVPTSSTTPAGTVHDPRARDLGGVAGHAGLFGTVDDVMAYVEVIRSEGRLVLTTASVGRMTSSQISPAVGAHSIGWFCHGNNLLPSGDLLSPLAFGHSGFTGVMALIDPTYDLSIVLLTNRVISESEDNSRFLRMRRLWVNTVAAAAARAT